MQESKQVSIEMPIEFKAQKQWATSIVPTLELKAQEHWAKDIGFKLE